MKGRLTLAAPRVNVFAKSLKKTSSEEDLTDRTGVDLEGKNYEASSSSHSSVDSNSTDYGLRHA